MKHLKTYESHNNNQQPFWLSKGDYLFLSDDIVKEYGPNESKKNQIYREWSARPKKYIDKYIYTTLGDKEIRPFPKITVRWDTSPLKINITTNKPSFAMDVYFTKWSMESRTTDAGVFGYFLRGFSGDSEMHGKSMVRGTQWSNYNFMCKLYPIFKYVKNGYNRLKNGEKFLDLISDLLDINPESSIHGVPKELKDKYPDYYNTFTNATKLGLI